jgi:site-specific recombinase XerD
MKSQIVQQRPLGKHQIVFLRELIEGVSARQARRHLVTADRLDEPAVFEEFSIVSAALKRAALAAGKPHLLNELPFDAIADRLGWELRQERPAPTADPALLAEKKAQIHGRAHTDAFSDEEIDAIARDELIAEGKVRKPPRRAPLPPPRWNRANARTALDLLAPLVAVAPAPAHTIEIWFTGGTGRALQAAGVNTIQDLTALILARGHRWNNAVKGLGALRAARIAAWLRQEASCWGPAAVIGPVALQPPGQVPAGTLALARRSVSALVPFEQIVLPVALDGSRGINRVGGDQGQILEANTDHGAIERWLAARCPNAHTRRAYRREAERLLLWCVAEKGIPLSSLTLEGCIEYREFLHSLGDARAAWPWRLPRSTWIASRGSLPRSSPLWRPFAPEPMSSASIGRALVILRALFDWLVQDVNYLKANPWRALEISLRARPTGEEAYYETMRRSLGATERSFIDVTLDALPVDERGLRVRFVIAFAMSSGLRREELSKALLADLQPVALADGRRRHVLRVEGKGGKRRTVSLTRQAEATLASYLGSRGIAWPLDPRNEMDLAEPLVSALRRVDRNATEQGNERVPGRPVTAQRLYDIARWAFERAAGEADAAGQPEAAHRLRQASIHWLRHTFGTRLSLANVDVRTIMMEMGHSDIRTSMQYISPDHAARFEQVDRVID